MPKSVMLSDYISPIKELLKSENSDKNVRLRRLIYNSRKINNRHLRKGYTVDRTVKRLLEPSWVAMIKQFNPDEWQGVADSVWRRASDILGPVPIPEIILYPGFNYFNGRVYLLDKRPVIGCSPDFPFTSGINLKVLLAHEYGHFARWRKTGIPTENVPIYALIYEEGWATWLSIKLYPELQLSRLFMSNLHKAIGMPDPRGGYLSWCRQNLDKIAGRARKALKSKISRDLGRFFQCRRYWGESTPIRVGYYLGFRLIEMLAEEHAPRKLLRIKPTPKMVDGWLDELIKSG